MASSQPGNARPAADPLTAAEFAACMAGCGPWGRDRRVGVAVSGGADSMALAVLLKAWGEPQAFIVDHGLRREAAAEADWTLRTLGALGMPGMILRLDGLAAGPALAARARDARHAALEAACAASGLVDLLYGHHARDQAETVMMRQDRGSGPAGLAGMAAVSEGAQVRRIRPLLQTHPARLRATLLAAGIGWVEDPSNDDPRAGRTMARLRLGDGWGLGLAGIQRNAATRAERDRSDAAELAARADIFPEGYARLSPGPIGAGALAALLRTVAGGHYPVSGVADLARAPRPATLAGARILPAGRHGPGWLVVREERAIAPPVDLATDAVCWDGRFRTGQGPAGATLGKLGDGATHFRRASALPAAVLRTLPAIRFNGMLCQVPHIAYAIAGWGGNVIHNASIPAACAPFGV